VPRLSGGGVGALPRVRNEVHRILELHPLGGQMKEQRRLQLTGVRSPGILLQEVGHVDLIEVEDGGGGTRGKRHEDRFEVGLTPVGADHQELSHAVVFPTRQKLVERAVEGLSTQARRTRVGTPRPGYAVAESGGAQDTGTRGHVTGDTRSHQRVRSQRQVGAVLVQGSDRHDEARVARQHSSDFRPAELVEHV
jgi:hypothetical protein